MTLKIATWNVNSVRSRLPQALAWLRSANPDIALLQEIKCVDEQFPSMEIEELGYNIATFGQKSYNGVAILSKFPLEDITRGLPGDESDIQSRYIEAVVSIPGGAVRVASVYVPNGNEVGSEKFAYKLKFFERLRDHAKMLLGYHEMLVIGGDYNVAPRPQDVFDPVQLDGTVCYHPDERARLAAIINLGIYDAFTTSNPNAEKPYSYWDYRAGMWPQNKGYRIDHLLLSAQAVEKLESCEIHKDIRAQEKASDHVPVMVTLSV